MAGGYRRKKTHKSQKAISGQYRLRRRTKDLDQIVEDLDKTVSAGTPGSLSVPYDEDLPGGGQFLCVECAKHFQDTAVLSLHRLGKPHKKRLRQLKVKPYTLEEANAAGGCNSNQFYSAQHTLLKTK